MKILKCFLLIFILTISYSSIDAQNIEEKLFEFRIKKEDPVYDGELFLLSNNVFCTVEYTEKENIVKSGTYVISDNSLTLSFKPLIITLGMKKGIRKWSIYLKKQIKESPPLVFSITNNRNQEELLGSSDNKYLVFGNRVVHLTEEKERIKELLASDEWKALNNAETSK